MKRAELKVLLVGVAGYNRGDDAICDCLIKTLFDVSRFATGTVVIQRLGVLNSGKPDQVQMCRKSISYHLQLARKIAESDLIVIGGGSIIQDNFGGGWIKGLMSIFVEVIGWSRLFRRPVISAPIGVDELRSARGRAVARFILRNCRRVVVRDQTSMRHAQALLGVKPPPVLSADPVFRYPHSVPPRVPELLVICPAFEGVDEQRLFSIHRKVIEQYVGGSAKRRCVILAMDDRSIEDGGKCSDLHSAILPSLRSQVEVQVPKTHRHAAHILRAADLVFAMRLHAIILAAGYTPVYCLSRGTKTEAISEELALPSYRLQDLKETQLLSEFAHFSLSMENADTRAVHLESCWAARAAQAARAAIFDDVVDATIADIVKRGSEDSALINDLH